MSEKPMRAYTAHDGNEGWAIVFATSGAAGRRCAANEMDCDFTDVEYCRRAPSLDQYAGHPVPIQAMLDIGWWTECTGCYRKISADEDDCDGPEWDGAYFGDLICDTPQYFAPLVPVGCWGHAWCCERCRGEYLVAQSEIKSAQNKAIADLSAVVLKRFPEVQITSTHAYAAYTKNVLHVEYVSVDFMFPGAKYGAGVRLEPCKSADLQWTVASGDREVFEDYAARSKELAHV